MCTPRLLSNNGRIFLLLFLFTLAFSIIHPGAFTYRQLQRHRPAPIGATAQRLAPPGALWRRLWRFPLLQAETATDGLWRDVGHKAPYALYQGEFWRPPSFAGGVCRRLESVSCLDGHSFTLSHTGRDDKYAEY